MGGARAVGRLGRRDDADLAWETDLLRHLDREEMPVPIPTTDGRQFADGLVVMTCVEGGPPETEADWRRVAATLRKLHRLTRSPAAAPGLAIVDRPTYPTSTSRCRTMPPISTTTRTTSPPRRGPRGRPPAA